MNNRCEQCGRDCISYWRLVQHQQTAHQQPRTEQARATVGELSVEEMDRLNKRKYASPEWLERYG